MNIDEKKLEDLLTTTGFNLVKGCEIKPADCDGCQNKNIKCGICKDSLDLISHFKPKQNELDKLFIGAPVIQCCEQSECYPIVYLSNHKTVANCNIRLPTIKEAPRNVWLAPWHKQPEKLINLNAYVKLKDMDMLSPIDNWFVSWDDVEAVMIMEDFKK